MNMANLKKESIYLELVSSFGGSVHYHHGGEAWKHTGRHFTGKVAEFYTKICRHQEQGAMGPYSGF